MQARLNKHECVNRNDLDFTKQAEISNTVTEL